MRIVAESIRLAATDLTNHLFCRHLTALNLAELRGLRKAPPVRAPHLVVLEQRGLDHEKAYIETLRATGLSFRDLSAVHSEADALAETLAAIASGIDIIIQGALRSGDWFGRPDVLRKVEIPAAPAAWTYEPYDCKLARETKAATILQLSHYAALIGLITRHEPESMYVVPPSSGFLPETYRVVHYAAYYRAVRRLLSESLAANPPTYPEPTAHCDVCRWWQECDRQWRRDDHLSFTAGITRLQRKQFVEWEIPTMEALSRLRIPLVNRPRYGSREGYVRVREQARVQVSARYLNQPVHEMLPLEPDRGLLRLPEPSPADIFFDLESDPYVDTRGREYLFGFGLPGAERSIHLPQPLGIHRRRRARRL